MHCLFETKIASFRLELGYAWGWHCSYTVSAGSYRNRHSSFSRTILSKEERCNQANPMWNTTLWDKVRPQHWELIICPTLCNKCLGSVKAPANYVTLKMQEMEPTFIVLIWEDLQEDLNVELFANVITKTAHSPRLLQDPKCLSGLSLNLQQSGTLPAKLSIRRHKTSLISITVARFQPLHLRPGLNASIVQLVLHIW